MRFAGFADTKLSFFFTKLAKNQNRAWFAAHKSEYDEGWHTPMAALLAEAREALDDAYPHLELGEPKVLRIYRDVRFSKDKTPYKTNVAGAIPTHSGAGGLMDSPSALYVHLGTADGCFAGAGSYHLEGPRLERLRKAILDEVHGKELAALGRSLTKKGYTFAAAETLKKTPKGIAADHPRAEWLRMKGLVVMFPEMPREKLASRAILDWTVKTAKVTAPFVEWLTFALA